jgi:DNA-directed RNA polymerase beta' subunit
MVETELMVGISKVDKALKLVDKLIAQQQEQRLRIEELERENIILKADNEWRREKQQEAEKELKKAKQKRIEYSDIVNICDKLREEIDTEYQKWYEREKPFIDDNPKHADEAKHIRSIESGMLLRVLNEAEKLWKRRK